MTFEHKWGIWWLFLTAMNSAIFGWDLTTGHIALALFQVALTVFCAERAFHALTLPTIRALEQP